MFYEFTLNKNTNEIYDTVYTYRSGGTGNNAALDIDILEGETEYFVINLEDGDPGPFGFRIRRNDADNLDGISSFRDEVQSNYDNGIFSPETNECRVEYNGDVNIFAYDVSSGNGYLCFDSVETILTVDIYTIYDRVGGFDKLWKEGTLEIEAQEAAQKEIFEFTEEIHYIDVYQKALPTVGSSTYFDKASYDYNFNFYDPRKPDSYDLAANATYYDSPVYPVQATLPYSNNTRTLHKGDSDWFTFTTTADGGNLTVTVGETSDEKLYNVELYEDVEIRSTESPSWASPTDIGTTETSVDGKSNIMTYDDLLANHTYFVRVKRPNSTTYSSLYPYSISIEVTTPNPTATLSGNVTLTHTAGEDITDLSAMKNAIMDQMTCTLYGEVVADSIALTDVELYYNDAVLTAATVNALTTGSYTIAPKYKGVAATGGTVTLTVAEAQAEDMVEVSLSTSIEYINEYDWLHCAKAMADYRLVREGSAVSTLSEDDAADLLGFNPDAPIRGTLYQTYKAVCLFYTNGQLTSDLGFQRVTNVNAVTEEALYDMIADDSIVIMQLADSTATTDVTKMRYLVICGVNKTTHQLKVYDCLQTSNMLLRWVNTSDVFDGGYISTNANVKFLGSIIEVSIN